MSYLEGFVLQMVVVSYGLVSCRDESLQVFMPVDDFEDVFPEGEVGQGLGRGFCVLPGEAVK